VFHGPNTFYTVELVIASLTLDGHAVLSALSTRTLERWMLAESLKQVCLRDFGWMKQCDLFIAVLPLDESQNVIHSSGTAIELGWPPLLGSRSFWSATQHRSTAI